MSRASAANDEAMPPDFAVTSTRGSAAGGHETLFVEGYEKSHPLPEVNAPVPPTDGDAKPLLHPASIVMQPNPPVNKNSEFLILVLDTGHSPN